MTAEELINVIPGKSLTYIGGNRFFTIGKSYIVYDSPVGKTVQNDNGVNKFVFDMLNSFKKG